MVNKEEEKNCKSDKSSKPASSANITVYPDWSAMQAYYGQRVALPPYYNSGLASGHAPPHPYMWGAPQPMIPPYGAPYAAMYPPGSVYPHPVVPHVATPLSGETPKLSGNTDQGLMKKLKQFDGLAMSIGNCNTENSDQQSPSAETEGSSEGSDGNTSGVDQTKKKRSHDGTRTVGRDGKCQAEDSSLRAGKENVVSNKAIGLTLPTAAIGKMVGPPLSSGTTATLELRNPLNMNAKTPVPEPYSVMPSESLLHSERELKREKRKQSNRESARRSRLRKQVEAEELANKVDTLTVENVALKSEIKRITDSSGNLKLENATLMEKLKIAQGQKTELILNKVNDKKAQPISTENLLSRVNNTGPADRSCDGEGDMYERSSKSGAKLHQLLDTKRRANVVAAG